MQRPVLSAGLIGDVADDLWSADIGILPGLRRPTQYNYRLFYHGFLRTCSGDNCVFALPAPPAHEQELPEPKYPMIGTFPACCARKLHLDRDQETAAPTTPRGQCAKMPAPKLV